ncbi:DUF3618 domain-containing protein [Kineococcus sp. T13]|uniref:DUF3618 domain-containing protein n=1 Tax=Kineococcus vitellinus TaxID=2696565 RepID=UPI0014120050|nr:DUF3618 domain-containing protein [Kineococcus vitellinus]
MAASGGKAEITTSDPRVLEREVELRRTQLAGTIDELTNRLAPAAIKERSIATARAKVLDFATDGRGSVRVGRVAAVAGVAVGVVVVAVVRAVRKRR